MTNTNPLAAMAMQAADASDDFRLDYGDPRVWYALFVRPGKEQDTADWLKHARLHAYWPCYTKQVNSGRKAPNGRYTSVARLYAVIPGYIFMAARPHADPWPVVRQVPGITGYIRDAQGDAAALTDNDIEVIRRIEGSMNLPPAKNHAHQFKPGHKVRLKDGTLARWPNGRILSLAENGQISVEVNLLGRAVTIWVRPHQIEAA